MLRKLEVISSNEIQDLRKREADISLRHVRPSHPSLIAKKIRDMSAHLYGSSKYLNSLRTARFRVIVKTEHLHSKPKKVNFSICFFVK